MTSITYFNYMVIVLAVWIDTNELGPLSLSRGRCLKSKYTMSIVGESVFVGFCILDLKTSYSIY